MTAVEKIELQAEKITRRSMKIQVADFIINKCKTDKLFAEKVNRESKNFVDCIKEIYANAQKWIKEELASEENIANGIGGDVPDEVVFEWAVKYFECDETAPIEKIKIKEEKKEKSKINKSEEKNIELEKEKDNKADKSFEQVSLF